MRACGAVNSPALLDGGSPSARWSQDFRDLRSIRVSQGFVAKAAALHRYQSLHNLQYGSSPVSILEAVESCLEIVWLFRQAVFLGAGRFLLWIRTVFWWTWSSSRIVKEGGVEVNKRVPLEISPPCSCCGASSDSLQTELLDADSGTELRCSSSMWKRPACTSSSPVRGHGKWERQLSLPLGHCA